jgi:hypothetical protein
MMESIPLDPFLGFQLGQRGIFAFPVCGNWRVESQSQKLRSAARPLTARNRQFLVWPEMYDAAGVANFCGTLLQASRLRVNMLAYA